MWTCSYPNYMSGTPGGQPPVPLRKGVEAPSLEARRALCPEPNREGSGGKSRLRGELPTNIILPVPVAQAQVSALIHIILPAPVAQAQVSGASHLSGERSRRTSFDYGSTLRH
ncbi:MAG: hypothetical protein GTO14_21740, partial [Anaerolineales bacterium]|nr:hypothetical protein [Anaerolineales bacterium]